MASPPAVARWVGWLDDIRFGVLAIPSVCVMLFLTG